MPGMLGTLPPLSNASPVFSFNKHPLFFAGMPLTPGCAKTPTMAVNVRQRIYCQLEFAYAFDHGRVWRHVQACVWEQESKKVCVCSGVCVRENKFCPKQQNKRAVIPACVFTLLFYWYPADVLGYFLYLNYCFFFLCHVLCFVWVST